MFGSTHRTAQQHNIVNSMEPVTESMLPVSLATDFYNKSLKNSSRPNVTSQQLDRDQTTPEFMAVRVFFYFAILSCSTLGNALVACIIFATKKMRTSSSLLILNLSICDLVTPLISIPFDFALEENGYSWLYGEFMCKFLWPCVTLTATSSSLTLAAISLDIYRIIMHPFRSRLSSKQVKVIIVAIHIVSLVFVSPYIHSLHLDEDSCNEKWPEFSYRQGYTLSLFLIQYGLPLIYMVVMYTLAVKNLRMSTNKMKKSSITGRKSVLSEKKSSNRWNNPNVRATKMFILVVVVFAVFMLPNQVVWLWADFGGGFEHQNFQIAAIVCWLFTYTNSVCNPLIYFMFSKDFRSGFKRLLRKIMSWKESTPTTDETLSFRRTSVRTGTETLAHSAFDRSHSDFHQDRCKIIFVCGAKAPLDKTSKKEMNSYSTSGSDTDVNTSGSVEDAFVGEYRMVTKDQHDTKIQCSAVLNSTTGKNCGLFLDYSETNNDLFQINGDTLNHLKSLPETDC